MASALRSTPARSTTGALLAALALAACSSKPADHTIGVTGTDSACTPAATSSSAGVIDFEFSNKGTKESELYLLRDNGDVVGEREGVGPGTTATLTVEVEPGSYTLQCKPGQTGEGIKTPFTVTS